MSRAGLIIIAGAVLAFLFFEKITTEELQIMTRAEFKAAFLKAWAEAGGPDIPVKAALAQAGLESGWGTGNVFLQTKNLFSITGETSFWKGAKYTAGTGRVFRVYNSLAESVADYYRLMHIPAYTKALAAAKAGNIANFYQQLEAAGYEGENYAQKLLNAYATL